MGWVMFKNHKKRNNEPLRLCKERKRLINSAIDSRYALSASHLSYIHSLQNIGVVLRRYAQAQLLDSPPSGSVSVSESNYPSSSSSPSRAHDEDGSHVGYPTRSRDNEDVGLTVSINKNCSYGSYLDREFSVPSLSTTENGAASSSDFFNPLRLECKHGEGEDFLNSVDNEKDINRGNGCRGSSVNCYDQLSFVLRVVEGLKMELPSNVENVHTEREDPSQFITHRAKDFVTSMKEIEHRFFRAFESGREVSRLLEANKIMVGYSESKGKPSATALLRAFRSVFHGGKVKPLSKGPAQKVICWRRIVPSQSSLFKDSLASPSKEDMDQDAGGSNSCTLERLYAWEKKLYDEVKASESIRKEYDRKCEQLRHQSAKDESTRVIDKTRSVVRDLHSRIIVAIYSFDTISKQIERVRDEELLPQLLELNQGSTRTIEADARREILAQLLEEFKCFGLSFDNWINSHTSYVESLNGWLQNCVLQPSDRSKNRRRPLSPRRVLAPPIFVLCRDWSSGIKALPADDLSRAIKVFVSELCRVMKQQEDKELQEKQNLSGELNNEETKSNNNTIEDTSEDDYADLCCIHESLTKVLSQMTKFSEASLKMSEDVKQKSQAAQAAYHNCKSVRTGRF
ncbi:uncharacterized protein LOC107621974 isoform X2 [Arachis ipaensis]|uniref:uncharacterized protein LOC107621974 isoform X2 n=1 Tax=Arachis ipaensis TaxID=130454 RepID=UPI000A2B06CF|nr:uncharacterized protein LOC107621974 isoform X2 [Arachis ipaensis]